MPASHGRRATGRNTLPETGTFGRIGRVLRFLRESRSLFQSELARKVELPASTISKYEIGLQVPSLDSLGKILDALDVSGTEFGEILDQANGRFPPEEPVEEATAAGDVVPTEALVVSDLLLGGARNLTPQSRRAFTEILAALYHLSRTLRPPKIEADGDEDEEGAG
jgi:transcriptional regulator with XRE-family HTH domain